MLLLPVFAGLCTALCWGVSDYLLTKPARALSQYAATGYSSIFTLAILIPFLIYTGVSAHASALVFILAVLSGAAIFLGNVLSLTAFRLGDLAITIPIIDSYPVVVVLGAVFLLGDKITGIESISIIAIILGIALISTKFSALKRRHKVVAAGVLVAVLAMLVYGIPGVFAGAYTVAIGFVLLSVIWSVVNCVCAFTTGRIVKRNMGVPVKKYLISLVGAGVTYAIGILAFLYGVQKLSSSLPTIAALAGFSSAITVICAFMLLKERPEKNQWIGIVLAVIGVVVLSYFS